VKNSNGNKMCEIGNKENKENKEKDKAWIFRRHSAGYTHTHTLTHTSLSVRQTQIATAACCSRVGHQYSAVQHVRSACVIGNCCRVAGGCNVVSLFKQYNVYNGEGKTLSNMTKFFK
jgi:hypothetical protein